MTRSLATAALFLLCACGSGENDPGPGGVTVGEARALDKAAEMLEKRRVPPELVEPALALPGAVATTGAAPEDAGAARPAD